MTKDQKELFVIVADMADHLPIEDPNKGKQIKVMTCKRENNHDGRKSVE